ncbi:hypothetical protein KSP39_PZI006466 [Platanthera zijinensis]|uniref:Uncharacterized protein n=1 Tax=Platanthera zijinensis TaxID=2320716 RepID=A0AAP0BPZ1_9ASPA
MKHLLKFTYISIICCFTLFIANIYIFLAIFILQLSVTAFDGYLRFRILFAQLGGYEFSCVIAPTHLRSIIDFYVQN